MRPSSLDVNIEVLVKRQEDAYTQHGLLLYFLDFSCYDPRDWEEGNNHDHPDQCAPAKNVIQEPDAHRDLSRKI